MDWTPVPEPVTWTLPAPATANGLQYQTVTLRAPTGADVLMATAIPGASRYDVLLRMIANVSAEKVPYEVVKALPDHLIQQMSDYFDEFTGAPAPDPLAAWREARRAAAAAAAGDGGANPAS